MHSNTKESYQLPDRRLKWVEKLSYLLDEQFRLPGTNFRFGLDPILNLIPFAGDMSGMLISAALVLTMAKNGASSRVVTLMLINVVLDATIGAIPLLGQVFDFFYKSNKRNIRLLQQHYQAGVHSGSGTDVLLKASLILIVIFVLLILAIWKLTEWVFSWF